MALPDFVVIGAQKSASTFIQFCLADHPQIFMPYGETSFFESIDYPSKYQESLEVIFQNRKEKILGIKRPDYLTNPKVPRRINSLIPNAKLIAILRNPVDRFVSAYYHYMRYGFIPIEEPEIGIKKILDNQYQCSYKRAQEIIDYGFYYKGLQGYLDIFEESHILIILHEDIIANKHDVTKIIYKYLDVHEEYVPSSIGHRPMSVVYNLSRLKFLRAGNSLVYQYNDEKTRLWKRKNILASAISYTLKSFDSVILSKVFASEKPSLSKIIRSELIDLYKDDIQALQKLINRDLSSWMKI
ncbi:sulfotransferase [Leptolyngbya sp. Heron Island J]|uniref:sulfotransferase family protein n=1 Tax=Leptolyngbya sp. Heron Island J TaxID=1385935 RepID=UPI0003B94B44|nr:sulfotransferase [Leptolyngbya sp. Heron Island J]ESA38758.1 sulfotransferase [Leptolyngbya sp. Heron Island J]